MWANPVMAIAENIFTGSENPLERVAEDPAIVQFGGIRSRKVQDSSKAVSDNLKFPSVVLLFVAPQGILENRIRGTRNFDRKCI